MSTELTNFERVEQKYLLTLEQKEKFLSTFADKFSYDAFCKDGKYKLESLYYDTDDLKFYWEKIHKNNGRIKIRLRRYVYESENFSEKSKVFIEIKEKLNGVGLKRRVKMSYEDARNLLEKAIVPEHKAKDAKMVDELYQIALKNKLRPHAITSYDRQAFFGVQDSKLRLTFDTNVRYKKNKLALDTSERHGRIVPAGISILEVKALGELPDFVLEFFQKNHILPAKISKYCGAIEHSDKMVTIRKEKVKAKKNQKKNQNFLRILRNKAFA